MDGVIKVQLIPVPGTNVAPILFTNVIGIYSDADWLFLELLDGRVAIYMDKFVGYMTPTTPEPTDTDDGEFDPEVEFPRPDRKRKARTVN